MEKFLRIAATVLIAVLSAAAANAITINWSASGSTVLTHAGGTTCLTQGSYLKLGYLSVGMTEAVIKANQDNITFVRSNLWGSLTLAASIGDGTSQEGTFASSWTGSAFAMLGRQMYLLAVNAPTIEAATEIGFYTNPNWVVPPHLTDPPLTLDLADAGLQAIIGDFSVGTVTTPDGLAGRDAAQLHSVPEPTSFVLVGVSLLVMLGVVRRRN